MPRRWQDAVDAHRSGTRDAIFDAVGALAAEGGMRSVTMRKIAERAGIGRATLYRYFPHLDAVLLAWHHAQITAHVAQLAVVAESADEEVRLRSVLETFVLLSRRSHGHHEADIEGFLYRDDQVERARHQATALIAEIIAEAAQHGRVRDDIDAGELAHFCVRALGGATAPGSEAALRRLVELTLRALSPEP